MADITIPEEASDAYLNAYNHANAVGKYSLATYEGLQAAAPLIVAAELERLVEEIDDSPHASPDEWTKAIGRGEVKRALLVRAAELRGGEPHA